MTDNFKAFRSGFPLPKRGSTDLAAPGQNLTIRSEGNMEQPALTGLCRQRLARHGIPDLDLILPVRAFAGASCQVATVLAEVNAANRINMPVVSAHFYPSHRIPTSDNSRIVHAAGGQVSAGTRQRHQHSRTSRALVQCKK